MVGEIVIFWREKLNTYVNVFSIFVSDYVSNRFVINFLFFISAFATALIM